MNETDTCEDRFLDCLLEENEGRGPDPDLLARTLARTGVLHDRGGPPLRSRAHAIAAAAVAVLATVVVVLVASGRRREAAAQEPDRPPAAWVAELADPARRDAAIAALQRAGERAVPALVEALEADPPRSDAARLGVLGALDAMEAAAAPALPAIARLVGTLESESPLLRPACAAAATLVPFAPPEARELGRAALVAVVIRSEVPAVAVVGAAPQGAPGAAGAAGGHGVPPPPTRELARFLHRATLPDGAPAAELLDALRGPSPFVRELAARLLGGHPGPGVAEALREALRSTHPTIVTATWPKSGGTISVSYHEDRTDGIHLAAARSLLQLAGGAAVEPGVHAVLLRLGTPAERLAAVQGLCRPELTGADAAAAAAALAAGLRATDPRLLGEIATAIGIVGHADAATRERLRELAASPDPQLAARARAALRRL